MTSIRNEPGLRSETIRRANLGSIIRELHQAGPMSRSGLVRRTGLTRSAIRGLIGELAGGGLVTEERATRLGTPGRPSPLVRLAPDGPVVLALDIEVDSLAAALVGLGGQVHEHLRINRRRGHSSLAAIVDDLAELASIVRARRSTTHAEIGIGVAVAGVVRRSDGLVSMAPNLGWVDEPLAARLTEVLGNGIPITVANEADTGALAEARRGVATGAANVLFISGEVGVGGGLIVGGRPYDGAAGYGGEIGHLPLNPAGLVCSCGGVGCWETEIGSVSMLRRAGRSVVGGRDEMEALLGDAAAGSPRALAALEETGRWLGLGLAGLVNVLNPELVVFGGLFQRIHPYVAAIVDAELDRRALPAPRRVVRVVAGSLGPEAPLIGAAELALEPILADPARWLRQGDVNVSEKTSFADRRVVA